MTLPEALPAVIVEQSPDAIIYSDASGTIQVWNAAAERIFGFTAGQAIGENLDIIIPEKFREAHWRGFERAMADGTTRYAGKSMPTRSLHRNGSDIVVELSFAIIIEAGEAIGALATARDITERFEQERANRKRLRELEAAQSGSPAS